jgi:hypothetical protein
MSQEAHFEPSSWCWNLTRTICLNPFLVQKSAFENTIQAEFHLPRSRNGRVLLPTLPDVPCYVSLSLENKNPIRTRP